MIETGGGKIEVDASDWYAVCDAGDDAQAIFPTENLAVWYLEKYGWTNWKIRRICGSENLLSLEDQRRAADDNEN